MTYRRRPFLPAVVGPRLAEVILREMGQALEQKEQLLAADADEARRAYAREIRAGLDSMAESAHQWRARLGSAVGTTEPRGTRGAPPLEVPSGGPELTTQEVVDQLAGSVSAEYVRRLCREGRLVGRQPGGSGAWLVQASSVAEYADQQRSRT